ncbi:MAG: hypothetical protein RBT81_04660 [Gammaproteobacteria bacterium]|jgi:hypothetical protein|nr:hypothetical protein [Gammaproteobacteria bacterium]
MIVLHRELPVLELRDRGGALVSTWRCKHEHPLVLVFAGTDDSMIEGFADRIDSYRSANARVLAVVHAREPGDGEPPGVPFPVLADDGAATRQYVGAAPATVVTDAYGVVEGVFSGTPDHERIIDLVRMLEMRCPECGVPEWPVEAQ